MTIARIMQPNRVLQVSKTGTSRHHEEESINFVERESADCLPGGQDEATEFVRATVQPHFNPGSFW